MLVPFLFFFFRQPSSAGDGDPSCFAACVLDFDFRSLRIYVPYFGLDWTVSWRSVFSGEGVSYPDLVHVFYSLRNEKRASSFSGSNTQKYVFFGVLSSRITDLVYPSYKRECLLLLLLLTFFLLDVGREDVHSFFFFRECMLL